MHLRLQITLRSGDPDHAETPVASVTLRTLATRVRRQTLYRVSLWMPEGGCVQDTVFLGRAREDADWLSAAMLTLHALAPAEEP